MKGNDTEKKYQVKVVTRAKRQLKKLPLEKLKLFKKSFKDLNTKPILPDTKKLKSKNNLVLYRARINLGDRLGYIVYYKEDLIYIIHAATKENTNYKEILKFFNENVKKFN